MSYLGTFEPKFEKTIVIFEISTFEFVKMQSFTLNQTKTQKKQTQKQNKKNNKKTEKEKK